MFLNKYLCLLGISALPLLAGAQPNDYPRDYFRNPLDIPILLAGNFGECRPNHFHSGIDIKTNGKENYAVYAAAEGYISRIKTERGGFGHALYVTHPNGYTTLYAHLNDFAPAIQKYLRQQQYKKENWEQDITLDPSQFPVKKGQQIAWSGNTGGSTAPHLHFEIRNTATEHPLNPMLFGFEITDNIAPRPTQLALYDLGQSIYEQAPQFVAVSKKGAAYSPAKDTIVINTALAGIGINVNDYMNGSDNTLTFYMAKLYMDGALQAEITLDDIGYDVTRYLHAYADHKVKKQGGGWIQCLFQLPGNKLDHIYKFPNNKKGALVLDDKAHNIHIELADAAGNTSNIEFAVKGGKGKDTAPCEKWFKPNETNTFSNANVSLSLDNKALYDWTCFRFSQIADPAAYSSWYDINKSYVPVHSYFDLRIKPDKAVPFDLRDKIVMIYRDGKDENGKAAKYEDGWYKASVRNFGTYYLVADNEPPLVKPLHAMEKLAAAKRISFSAIDKITSVKKFRAELDGQWLLFEQHGSTFFYVFDEHCPKGKHELVVTATDENNNTRTLRYTFVR